MICTLTNAPNILFASSLFFKVISFSPIFVHSSVIFIFACGVLSWLFFLLKVECRCRCRFQNWNSKSCKRDANIKELAWHKQLFNPWSIDLKKKKETKRNTPIFYRLFLSVSNFFCCSVSLLSFSGLFSFIYGYLTHSVSS